MGVPKSSYAFYEDGKKFKKDFLPVDKARTLATIFSEHGIDREEVIALAGVEPELVGDFGGIRALELQDMADQLGLALVPEIDIAYAMGDGAFTEEFPHRGYRAFGYNWLKKQTATPLDRLAVVHGDGDSMQPTLRNDDDILIDLGQNKLDRQDRIWAFTYGDLGMIKRLRRLPSGQILVISDNQTVAAYEASPDEVHIIGRVIWVGHSI